MSELQIPSIAHLPKPALVLRAVLTVALLSGFYVVSAAVICVLFALPILYVTTPQTIYIWLAFFLFVVCWGTAGSLTINLFVYQARPFFPKGRRIEDAEAPEFMEFIQAVASATGTAPIEEVYLTEGASLDVHEIGGSYGRPLRRILVVGAPLVAALSAGELRAGIGQQVAFYSFGSARALRVIRYCSKTLAALADGPKAEQFNELSYHRPLETSIGFAKDLTHLLTVCIVAIFDAMAESLNAGLHTAADQAAGVIAGNKATVRFLKRKSVVHYSVEPYRERITYVARWAVKPSDLGAGFGNYIDSIVRYDKRSTDHAVAGTQARARKAAQQKLASRLERLREATNTTTASTREPASALFHFDFDALLEPQLVSTALAPSREQVQLQPVPWAEIAEAGCRRYALGHAALVAERLANLLPPTPNASALFLAVLMEVRAGRLTRMLVQLNPILTSLNGMDAREVHDKDYTKLLSSLFCSALLENRAAVTLAPIDCALVFEYEGVSLQPTAIIEALVSGRASGQHLEQWAVKLAERAAYGKLESATEIAQGAYR